MGHKFTCQGVGQKLVGRGPVGLVPLPPRLPVTGPVGEALLLGTVHARQGLPGSVCRCCSLAQVGKAEVGFEGAPGLCGGLLAVVPPGAPEDTGPCPFLHRAQRRVQRGTSVLKGDLEICVSDLKTAFPEGGNPRSTSACAAGAAVGPEHSAMRAVARVTSRGTNAAGFP